MQSEMQSGSLIANRYELQELLGRGGMAEVWRAQDRHLDRTVAVKFLAERLAEDAEFLVRFFSEAQSVARITHPNVVGILDFGAAEGHPFLVMEHIKGGSLSGLTGVPLMPERALEIAVGAARGAGAAHAIGVVHRDIKPDNILLDDEGRAKLADFGIAASRAAEPMTATGRAIGSPHYISPEQVAGEEVTPASDVYSLGVVLYEMLAGRRPFEAESITALAIAHVEREPLPPSAHLPELGPGLDALVLRCLAKDPDGRFADGSELADVIESGDFATLAAAPEADPGERASPSRRLAVAGIALAALLALGSSGFYLFGRPGSTPPAKASTPDRSPGTRAKTPSPSPTQTAASGNPVSSPRPSPSEPADDPTERAPAAEPSEEPAAVPSKEPTPAPTEVPTPGPSPSVSPAPTSGSEGGSAVETPAP